MIVIYCFGIVHACNMSNTKQFKNYQFYKVNQVSLGHIRVKRSIKYSSKSLCDLIAKHKIEQIEQYKLIRWW